MSKIHPQYVPRDPSEVQSISSSVQVIRTSDNAQFLAAKLPEIRTKDAFSTDVEGKLKSTTKLASAVLPVAALPISRILNHQNIISLIDIVHKSALEGYNKELGSYSDITVWEDMDAGSLAYLLPDLEKLPRYVEEQKWYDLTQQNFNRFSLPESLCWHVLKSISHALLWLHFGVKETPGMPGEYRKADDDWQPILIMDVSPSQIWFKRPREGETYGECKLGGFQWAKVTSAVGGLVAKAHHRENPPRAKAHYFPPEIYNNTMYWTRASEIWALGATIYTMMTGIPYPRIFEHNWKLSRMNDKGFSQPLREIVESMLKPHPADRPSATELVNKVNYQWRKWRADTPEGRQYVDVKDKILLRKWIGVGPALTSIYEEV